MDSHQVTSLGLVFLTDFVFALDDIKDLQTDPLLTCFSVWVVVMSTAGRRLDNQRLPAAYCLFAPPLENLSQTEYRHLYIVRITAP